MRIEYSLEKQRLLPLLLTNRDLHAMAVTVYGSPVLAFLSLSIVHLDEQEPVPIPGVPLHIAGLDFGLPMVGLHGNPGAKHRVVDHSCDRTDRRVDMYGVFHGSPEPGQGADTVRHLRR